MTTLRWGQLTSTTNGHVVPLEQDGVAVATLRVEGHDTSLVVGDQVWRITGSKEAGVSAILPDGRVFRAVGKNNKKIGRAAEIDCDFSGDTYTFVNEVSSDWIIDDASSTKVAQFTGARHGVRHTELELEDSPVIPVEHSIFAAYIARLALERKMMSMTAVFTICLALLAPFTAIVLLLS